MAADVSGGGSELPQWVVTLGASVATAIGALILAIINRVPAFQAAIQAATKTLIEGYETRVAELTAEVHALRAEVVALRKALDSRPPPNTGFGA